MSVAFTSELISRFTNALGVANSGVDLSVILVGSVARGMALAESDLDLVVVSEAQAVRAANGGRLHVQYFTRSELIDRLRMGDDFAAWCLRYGVPLIASRAWSAVVECADASNWPDWRAKLPHAARRLHLASSMLKTGDFHAAAEEALYALTHVGRALLLKDGEFPLSRPEMVTQLATAGHLAIGNLLERFIFHSQDAPAVSRAIRYVKKRLVHLGLGTPSTRPNYEG